MSKPENPQAFPRENWDYGHEGMTLRDYFAGQVLSGAFPGGCPREIDANYLRQHGAKSIYAIADAMLAEREKSNDDT